MQTLDPRTKENDPSRRSVIMELLQNQEQNKITVNHHEDIYKI